VIDADEIIVLEAGRIIERGTHESLLRRGAAYAAMWNRQQQADAARQELARAEGGETVPAE
jgi:ATP-binding cassette subfamily B protein